MDGSGYVNVTSCFIGAIVFFVLYRLMRRPKNLPPGPLSLPIIGTVYKHDMKLDARELTELSKQYGDIFRISLFGATIIVLSSYRSIEEAICHRLDFCHKGLSHQYAWRSVNPNRKGIFVRDCDSAFMKTKNACTSVFRNLGVGKGKMEEKMLQEISVLLDVFVKQSGKTFDPCHYVSAAISNVILLILINERRDYDDSKLQELMCNIHDYILAIDSTHTVNNVPITRFIPAIKERFGIFVKSHKGILDYLADDAEQLVKEHEATQKSNFVDCYLEQMYGEENNNVDVEEIKYILHDLIVGGFETSSTSIKWTLIYLANRPDVQQKVFDEISAIVGTEKPVTLSHKDELHYLQATIWEVQRFNTLLPIMPRMSKASGDSSLFQYTIPKNTPVFLNLYSVHMDKETWGDPEVFRPERFLDANGRFVKHKHVIPFSLGKRSCGGEILAKQELFLFTAALFQKFEILPPEGQDKIDEVPQKGGSLYPKPFQIRALLR